MQKRQLGPCVTFFPQPTTLVSTVGNDGRKNVMTASWAGIVSKTPPTMAISLNKGRKSYQHIHETGDFVVNMVPASLVVEADYCGLRSGSDDDKFEQAGLVAADAQIVKSPLVDQCPLNVECRFVQEVEIGDYRLILGEIVEVNASEEAFAAEGGMDARTFDPLTYLGGIREYWSLGDHVADAYKDGSKLFKKQDG